MNQSTSDVDFPTDLSRRAVVEDRVGDDVLSSILAEFADVDFTLKLAALDAYARPNGELYRQQTIASSWSILDRLPIAS